MTVLFWLNEIDYWVVTYPIGKSFANKILQDQQDHDFFKTYWFKTSAKSTI